MARKRMIDPEFWSDEKIAKLPSEARLLFIGLWNFADDDGIFKDHPALIASEIFPYEKEAVGRVENYLMQLQELNLVYRYNIHGQGYGIVLNFLKHQAISHPQPSKLPHPSIQNNTYRNAIFARDGFVCHYCRQGLTHQSKHSQDRPTIDHVISQAKGGSHLPTNLVTACEKCNKGKCDDDAGIVNERSLNIHGTLTPSISEEKLSKEKLSKVKRSEATDQPHQAIINRYLELSGTARNTLTREQVTGAYKRHSRSALALISEAGGLAHALNALEVAAAYFTKKALTWTLDTVAKHLPKLEGYRHELLAQRNGLTRHQLDQLSQLAAWYRTKTQPGAPDAQSRLAPQGVSHVPT